MSGSDSDSISFGPFRLFPAARTIEKDGLPLELGNRALDILIALVERAGEVVSHRELIDRAWRGLVVEPGNLRVHVSGLRKALGDSANSRYIANVPGQGYCFVAPVGRGSLARAPASIQKLPPDAARQKYTLPPMLARMVGRDDVVRTIAAQLLTDRFMTIIGPGGMGKTTVAVSVAHMLMEEFAGNVCFVDLGAITDDQLLATTVASTLGLTIQSADVLPTLMSFLQAARMLLLLDNCEHVIDAAASLAEMIFSQASEVHILATSREALRVEGEHAHWLHPLESPPQDVTVSAEAGLAFPAVKLLVERAAASDTRFTLTDENAPLVSGICRRLDGIALALEIVAARVGTYGLQGTADLLDHRLSLHWRGRRTALPRHQTLGALLDWSYGLLPESEQRVMRRLGIFVGPFTLQAAHAVTSGVMSFDDELDEADLANALDSLIAKSLVSMHKAQEGEISYRLLETTRIYALKQLENAGEADPTAERHARYFVGLLNKTLDATRSHHEHLGNLRTALEWCFGRHGGPQSRTRTELGIDLAAAAAATLLHLSLWSECLTWSKAALTSLPNPARSDRRELVLQEALAISSMYTGADARPAIMRGIEIARRLSEASTHLRLLASLHFLSHRVTDFQASLAVGKEIDAVARTMDDPISWAIADWLQGSSQYCLGNQAAALQLFERGFTHGGDHYAANAQQLGIYYRSRGLIGLARVQWLCGYPERALQTARQALAESADTTSVNRSYALLVVCHVFLWRGDLDAAQDVIENVMTQPHWQGRLVWFHTEALALKGEVLLRRGNLAEGVELLRTAMNDMKTKNQKNLMLTVTACALAEGLAASGRVEEAFAVITDTLAHPPGNAETWEAPELLRVRADILQSMPQPDEDEAERNLLQSLALTRRQNARGWELRTTMTLARLRARQGRRAEAHQLLSAIYGHFTEGFDTADLQAAKQLLAS